MNNDENQPRTPSEYPIQPRNHQISSPNSHKTPQSKSNYSLSFQKNFATKSGNFGDIGDSEEILKCAGKLAFNSEEEAKKSATAIEHQRGIKLNAYLCNDCDLWHLSSKVW